MYESLAVAINEARTNGGDAALRHYSRTEFAAAANPNVLLRPSNGARPAAVRRRSVRAWLRAWWANGTTVRPSASDD